MHACQLSCIQLLEDKKIYIYSCNIPKKEAVNVLFFFSIGVSSLKGSFLSALVSCYLQKEKKQRGTGKLPNSNIFFLHLTFADFFFSFFFFYILANDSHGVEQKITLCLNSKNKICKIMRLFMKRGYKPLSETVIQVFLFLPKN